MKRMILFVVLYVFISPIHAKMQNDFNNDNISDILWRNQTTGQYYYFFMNADGTRKSFKAGYAIDTIWDIVAVNDLNQDNIPDLLWRNKSTGRYLFFFMNADGTRRGYKHGYQIDTDWKIEGFSDINQDNIPDILWRNKITGRYLYYFMNADGTRRGYKHGLEVDPSWKIVNKSALNKVSLPSTNSFINASARATAYVENQKIVTYDNHTFISFLDFIDSEYKVHIVHLYKFKVIDEVYLDNVHDSHGGGSIALNNDKKLCAVYGGHNQKLIYRCSTNELNITTWSDATYIDSQNLEATYQTYPSISFDENNTLSLLYRETNIDADNRKPKFVYMQIKGNAQHKIYEYETNHFYMNFSATLIKDDDFIDILAMEYGILDDKRTNFNKGVFLHRSADAGQSFDKLPIAVNANYDLSTNYYISNLVSFEKKCFFIVMDRSNPLTYMQLCIVDRDNNINRINLLHYAPIQKVIESGYIPNVRVSMNINKKGEIFFALPFVSRDDNSWSSLSNRVHYFKLSKNLEDMALVFKEDKDSWLVNIDKSNSTEIPSIIYSSLDTNITTYKYLDSF